jgi:hypothetical protein
MMVDGQTWVLGVSVFSSGARTVMWMSVDAASDSAVPSPISVVRCHVCRAPARFQSLPSAGRVGLDGPVFQCDAHAHGWSFPLS